MTIQYKLTAEALALQGQGICDCSPVRGTPLSAGMDLKACLLKPLDILPYDTVKVGTGLHIWLGEVSPKQPWITSDEVPYNYWNQVTLPMQLAGFLLPRSSAKGIQLENTVGLLDCDYQQEVFIKLYNKTEDTITIAPSERIAQLVILPVVMDTWILSQKDWEETSRIGGDGSTGKF